MVASSKLGWNLNSVKSELASRLGIHLGDTLAVTIGTRNLSAVATSLRHATYCKSWAKQYGFSVD